MAWGNKKGVEREREKISCYVQKWKIKTKWESDHLPRRIGRKRPIWWYTYANKSRQRVQLRVATWMWNHTNYWQFLLQKSCSCLQYLLDKSLNWMPLLWMQISPYQQQLLRNKQIKIRLHSADQTFKISLLISSII